MERRLGGKDRLGVEEVTNMKHCLKSPRENLL